MPSEFCFLRRVSSVDCVMFVVTRCPVIVFSVDRGQLDELRAQMSVEKQLRQKAESRNTVWKDKIEDSMTAELQTLQVFRTLPALEKCRPKRMSRALPYVWQAHSLSCFSIIV